jgi:uncharacterized membrane protein
VTGPEVTGDGGEHSPSGKTSDGPDGLGMSVSRLEAFSDGVLAIVITLLILEIDVPEKHTRSLNHDLAEQWPQYVAYLLSFMIVGIIWLNHHAVINLLARTNHTLQVLNLLLLLPVSVLPWPTALLAEFAGGSRHEQQLAVLIYGLVSSLMAISFNVLWRYILRHPELHKPQVTQEMLAVRNRRFNVGPYVYPIATLIGLLSAPLFLALMLALAVLYLLPTPDVRVQGSA